ncbi:hypothetical protein B0H11DRAFT_115408 [Mycena galericulata]|nr:hypothetical protein B0H11DRAFT_115408 [Mycena galericulata]
MLISVERRGIHVVSRNRVGRMSVARFTDQIINDVVGLNNVKIRVSDTVVATPRCSPMNKLQDNAPPQRRAPSDVFRPRLPLDPFAPAQLPQRRDEENENVDPDAPWTAHDFAIRAAAYALGPHVLLVLGAPHAHAVAPILRSPTFARSLLLFLTHAPPPLSAFIAAAAPNGLCPAIKILRLATPLDPAAPAFALTLVHILDAAADVSRAWRASLSSSNPYPKDIEQLAQDANGAFTLPEPLAPESPPVSLPVSEHLHPASAAAAPARRSRLASGPSSYAPGSTSTRTSPARPRPKSALSLTSTGFFSPPASPISASPSGPSKRNSLTKPPPPASAHTTPSKRSSALLSSKRASSSSSSSSASGKGKGKPRPASTTLGHKDPSRPFDALLSFLPPSQPERAVLKQVVLTSTLAGAFVSGRPWACACGEAESQGGVGGFEWGATSSSAPPSPSYARGSYPYTSGHSYSYGEESRPGSAGASTSRPASVFAAGAGASRPGSFVSGGDFLPASAPASTRSRSKSRSRFSFLLGGGGSGEGSSSSSSKSVPGSRRGSFLGSAYGSASASVATLGVGFNYSSSTLGLDAGGTCASASASGCYGGTNATARAHIIHVLPASYRSGKLTGALDAFLRSYAPSAPPSLSHSHSHTKGEGAGRGPKAYVLAERALRDVECVLVGALEGTVSSSSDSRTRTRTRRAAPGRTCAPPGRARRRTRALRPPDAACEPERERGGPVWRRGSVC